MRNGTRRISATFAFVIFTALAWARPSLAEKLPVEVFAQLPSVSMPRLSPDGQYLAMIQPVGGRPHLVVQKADGSASPVVIPPLEESEINKYRWANNDRLLIHMSKQSRYRNIELTETRLLAVNRDGSEYKNIIHTDLDKGNFSRLQSKYSRAQIQDNVISYLPDDPDHILLAMDEKMDGLHDLRIVNINTGAFKIIRDAMRGVQNWMSDNEGQPRLAWGVDNQAHDPGRTTNKFSYYAGTDGNFSRVSDDHITSELNPLGFAADPTHAYMNALSEHGTEGIFKVDLENDDVIEAVFIDESYDATGLLRDPLNDTPIGVKYIGEGAAVQLFDEAWARRYNTINGALKDTYNTIVSTTQTRDMHIIHARGPREPGFYYLYDEANKQIHPLAMAYNNLEPNQLAEVKPISFAVRDGTTIPAYLSLPNDRDGKNLPAVILPHGGPQARDSMEFDYLAQFMANRGYAVLQPNFRGSTGYGRAFRQAGYEQWGLLMQDDVTDATKWLAEQGIADPDRICIVGWSYGGYAALMGAAKEPELYSCAVSINGVTDIERLVLRSKDFIGGTLMTQHVNQENQEGLSPVNLTDQIKTPVLLIHAEDDMTVEFRQAKAMAKALKRSKVKHRFVEIETGRHSLKFEASRLTALTELEKWLDKYIGD